MKFWRIPSSIAVLAALAACAPLSAPPRDTFYRLQLAAPAADAHADAAAPVIFVPPFAASDLHSERALVYTDDDGSTLAQYAYHFWIESPRNLLQQLVADRLRGRLARQVVLEPSAAAAYVVRGHIRKFERAGSGSAASAQVSLQFEVLRRGEGVPVFERTYERAVAVQADTVAAVAAAMSEGARTIVDEFAHDLAAHLGS